MITLYHFERSGNSREVRLVLHEKHLKFEEKILDVMKGETRTPDFLKLNPFGKVPVLTDGDVVLYESAVINYYLDDKYPEPSLMPKTPEKRAEVRKWVYWGTQKMEKHLAPVLLEMLLKTEEKWDKEMIEKNKKALTEAIDTIDQRLQGREYICDEYSLADVCVTPHLAVLGRIKYNPNPDLPNFHEWMKRLKQRPNFKDSISH